MAVSKQEDLDARVLALGMLLEAGVRSFEMMPKKDLDTLAAILGTLLKVGLRTFVMQPVEHQLFTIICYLRPDLIDTSAATLRIVQAYVDGYPPIQTPYLEYLKYLAKAILLVVTNQSTELVLNNQKQAMIKCIWNLPEKDRQSIMLTTLERWKATLKN